MGIKDNVFIRIEEERVMEGIKYSIPEKVFEITIEEVMISLEELNGTALAIAHIEENK